jgi:hypothetical protein
MGSCQKPYALIGLLLIALSLTGCPFNPVKPANEYQIALQELDVSWLDECRGLGDVSDRKVGTLLQDFTDLSGVAAPCRLNHNALVEYLRPIIEKAKAGE